MHPANLEVALGGAAILAQLADPGRSGQIDDDIVTDYLESGAAEIRSASEVKHDPEVLANLDADSLRRLRDANASLSARIAYEKGGLGLAMPDHVRDRAERAERFLDQLAKGERRLGRVSGGTAAAINQPVGVVSFDPEASGVSIDGFKRGFR